MSWGPIKYEVNEPWVKHIGKKIINQATKVFEGVDINREIVRNGEGYLSLSVLLYCKKASFIL